MTNRIGSTVLGIVTSAAALVLVGGGTAVADGQASNSTAVDVSHRSTSSDVHAQGWQYYDWYWSGLTCASAGEALVDSGYAEDYDCVLMHPTGTPWNLYVYR